jgi:hypothetical protein
MEERTSFTGRKRVKHVRISNNLEAYLHTGEQPAKRGWDMKRIEIEKSVPQGYTIWEC